MDKTFSLIIEQQYRTSVGWGSTPLKPLKTPTYPHRKIL